MRSSLDDAHNAYEVQVCPPGSAGKGAELPERRDADEIDQEETLQVLLNDPRPVGDVALGFVVKVDEVKVENQIAKEKSIDDSIYPPQRGEILDLQERHLVRGDDGGEAEEDHGHDVPLAHERVARVNHVTGRAILEPILISFRARAHFRLRLGAEENL